MSTTAVPPTSTERPTPDASTSQRNTVAKKIDVPVDSSWGGALRRPISIIGGLAMLATPLLCIAGELTSPPQASRAQADYIESLARDPWLSSISASLLHYGWIALALGLVVAMTLIKGRRGRVLTLIGGIGGGFATVQMSALMQNDYVLVALGNNLPMADAVRVADALMKDGDVLSTFVWQCATLALILPVFLYLGMARAKIISWWVTPLALFPMIAPFVVMGLFNGNDELIGTSVPGLVAGAVVGLICYIPTFLVGWRLLQQGRAGQN